jgi:tetratricopeptide (TPR) repeat protein
VVVAVLLVWSVSHGGFALTTWYPGAVGLVLVLAVLAAGLRPSLAALPRVTLIALAALALFTAWSFASIAWADARGVAWEGANRTLLYLAIFAICALSSLDAKRALLVVGSWTIGILVLAVLVLVRLPDAVGTGPAVLGPGLAAPVGYSNAAACLWLMAAWPALVLACSAAPRPALRGLFAGGSVVLFDVALLSESSGATIAAGICLVVLLVALPGRVRALLTFVPIAIGLAVTAPHAIDVSRARREAGSATGDLASLAVPIIAAALVVAVLVTLIARRERARPAAPAAARRVHRGVAAAAAAVAVCGAGVALAVVGDPVDAIDERWQSFKLGATVDPATGTLAGFGGARYDYYRVAADVIADHPLAGVGADNFAQDYAEQGRAGEFPAYVHSIELRTLVHTGLIGGLLLAAAFGAALAGAVRVVRGGSAAAAAAAAGAAMVFVHWAVQGSADWFWEFPALGGAAFAMLGVACALVARDGAEQRPRASRALPRGAVVLGVALLVACCVSLAGPWTSAILTERAGRVWPIDAAAAFRQLDLAADLNPLSSRPQLVEGTIALRSDRPARADAAFERALRRDPRNAFATLALGALASQRGDAAGALVLVRRAAQLNRQDSVTLGALAALRAGRPIDVSEMLDQYQRLARAAAR